MSRELKVLAAIDLGPESDLVLERALALTRGQPNAELHVITVVTPEVPFDFYPTLATGDLAAPARDKVVESCKRILGAVAAEDPSTPLPKVVAHAVIGVAAHEIVWFAAHHDVDFIVVSSHGRRGLKRLLVGSVAEKVVRLAGCGVVVVRSKNHDPRIKLPEIEPLCTDCATERARTDGKELWCERHGERHAHAHLYGYSDRGLEPPHAWSSMTGT